MMTALQTHSLCVQVRVVETREFSPDQFYVKIRAELRQDARFQVRVYHNQGHVDYAYQLFADVPLLRWDNKEEFRHLKTFPHHHHDDEGGVYPSPLTGNPVEDMEVVLQEIVAFLNRESRCEEGSS
jgi:hypothetical protein